MKTQTVIDSRKIEEEQNIQRILSMPTYEGFLRPDGYVHIPWLVGVDYVSLDVFLKGAVEKKKRGGGNAYLQVSLPESLKYNELVTKSVELKLNELEEKYPISCSLTFRSVDELQASHFFHNTCK